MTDLTNTNFTFISNSIFYKYDDTGNQSNYYALEKISVANDVYSFNVSINTTSLSISNDIVQFTLKAPTVVQNSSGNYYLNANGSWTTVAGVGSVNTDAQFIWTNTHTFQNTITFNSTINGTSNNSLYLNGNSVSDILTYANNKAANAYSNAIAYSGNAVQAYSNAVSYVDGKSFANTLQVTSNAATSYSNSISYADNKASTAYSNATSFATTIAGTAYSNAIAYSGNAVQAYSNAVSYVDGKSYVNTSQLSSNLSNYQTTAGLSANVATLTSNNATYAFGKSEGNLNVNSATYSNSSIYINANTGIISNTSGVFVNSSYIATIASNSANYANASISNTFTVGTASYFVSNGNIGIGTNSPSEKLDVNGNIKIDNGSADGGQLILASSGYTDWYTDNYNGSFRFINGATERMRITTGGLVGINTSSPSYLLDIESGSASVSTGLRIKASTHATSRRAAMLIGDWLVLQDSNANGTKDFAVYDTAAGATRLSISPTTGNFIIGSTLSTGLGVSTGDASIELGSNRTGNGPSYIDFHSTSGSDYDARILRDSGTNGGLGIYNTGTGDFYIGQNNAGALILKTNNAERVRLDSSGNVGIGTSSPSRLLQILDTSTNYQFKLGSSDPYNYDIGRNMSDGLLYFYGNQTGYNGYVFTGVDGERMRITSAGRVGIGTNSPASTLHVYNAGTDNFVLQTANSSYLNRIYYQNGSRVWTVGQSNGNEFWIADETAGAVRLAIDTNGYVRSKRFTDIDDTSYYVDPAGGSNLANLVTIQGSGLNAGIRMINWTALRDYRLIAKDDGRLCITDESAGAERFTIGTDGTVTILGGNAVFYPSSFYLQKKTIIGPYAGSSTSGGVAGLEIKNNGGTGDSNLAAIAFHCTGTYATHMHLRADGYFGIGGWSANPWRWYVNLGNGNMTAEGSMYVNNTLYAGNDTSFYLAPRYAFRFYHETGAWGLSFSSGSEGFFVANPNNNGQTIRLGTAWGLPGVYNSGALWLMSDNGQNIHFVHANNLLGYIDTGGNMYAYTYNYMSDRRMKTNIEGITSALDKIKSLHGIKFIWAEHEKFIKSNKSDYGLLADEVEAFAPELINETIFESPDGDKYKSVDYVKIIPFLVEAIKEQQKQIDNLKTEIENLKKG